MANPFLNLDPAVGSFRPGEGQKHSASGRDMNGNEHPSSGSQTKKPAAAPKKTYSGPFAGMRPELAEPLQKMIAESGGKLSVTSGFRTRAEQQKLYDKYKAGKGNPAAKPGTSNHEFGLAADIGGDHALIRRLAIKHGLVLPVKGEAWHVEPKNAKALRGK